MLGGDVLVELGHMDAEPKYQVLQWGGKESACNRYGFTATRSMKWQVCSAELHLGASLMFLSRHGGSTLAIAF